MSKARMLFSGLVLVIALGLLPDGGIRCAVT